jgi:hypothetical protein
MPSVINNLPDASIPAYPGVPPLPGGPAPFPAPTPTLARADAPGVFSLIGQSRWGLFGPGGASILTVDAVASIEYAKDFSVSKYPQQKGSFESYNKVEEPFIAKIGFLLGPSRHIFLDEVEAWLKSLEFVTVVTPEISYPSANLVHFGYRRTQRHGVTLMLVEVWCEEIRVTATTGAGVGNNDTASINGNDTRPNGTALPTDAQNPAGNGNAPGAGSSADVTTPPVTPGSTTQNSQVDAQQSWRDLNTSQQQSILNQGAATSAGNAVANAIDGDGNSVVDYGFQ